MEVKGTKGQEILARLREVRKELEGILRELEASEKPKRKGGSEIADRGLEEIPT